MISLSRNPLTEGNVEIRFDLAANQAAIRVELFDVSGRLVRDLFSGPLSAGPHSYQWDGRDADGVKSPSGTYFIRVQANGLVFKTKLVRLQ